MQTQDRDGILRRSVVEAAADAGQREVFDLAVLRRAENVVVVKAVAFDLVDVRRVGDRRFAVDFHREGTDGVCDVDELDDQIAAIVGGDDLIRLGLAVGADGEVHIWFAVNIALDVPAADNHLEMVGFACLCRKRFYRTGHLAGLGAVFEDLQT